MALKTSCFIVHSDDCHLLYNPTLLPTLQLHKVAANFLNNNFLQIVAHFKRITTGGRGRAWFVEMGKVHAVYRQYQRGGLLARVNRDIYVATHVEKSRSFKEWRLLQQMLSQGLPVPQPIAASVCRWPFKFSPFYRAQILVKRIPDVETLDQILCQRPLTEPEWHEIGRIIGLFHHAGVYHADLNANNILLNGGNQVFLIDFDKSEFRDEGQAPLPWMKDNINRLKRSLLKQQGKHDQYHFSEGQWQMLIAGYKRRP